MAKLRIHRDHSLGLAAARRIALAWAEEVERDYGMECTIEEGDDDDVVHFARSGVRGTLAVSADHFDLNAQLGILVGAFKDHIEGEIIAKLDALLAQPAPRKAAARKPRKS